NVVTDQTVDYDMYGSSYLSTTSSTSATASVTWNLHPPLTGKYEVCVWSPQKTSATTVQYTVNSAAGATVVNVNQQYFGGRWYRLGDFNFYAGAGSVMLTNRASTAGAVVMADAVKITAWPGGVVPCTPGDFDCDQDVDQTDFAHLQLCLTGLGIAVSAPCQD